jgi:peroxiredoxin
MDNGRQGTSGIACGGALTALLCCLFLAWPAAAGRTLEGEAAPDFVLKSLDGTNRRLSEYQGSVVILTFWAARCGDCREQMSQLNAMQTQFGPQGLQVLSVNIDKHLHQVEKTTQGMQLNFPVLLDRKKRVAKLYDPSKLPLTVLIDPAGNVRQVHQGYGGKDTLIYTAELESLLADFGPLTDQG